MISVFVEKESIRGNIVEIREKQDINHLKNSFRMKAGDKLRVVDGEFEYMCRIVEVEKKEILAEIEERIEDRYSTEAEIDIAQGLLKNDKMDLTIQKLTEIGINRIIPMVTERTVVKVKEKKGKWDVVSREALKQCQGVKLVDITAPQRLKDIDFDSYDLVLLPYECAEGTRITDILDRCEEKPGRVLYLIGPEGGFSEKEVEFLVDRGANVISLGKRILRAETAAIVAGGILVNELG